MRVSVGVHHRGQPEDRIGVTTIALHPSWSGSNVLTHDLAVLTLAHPVTFTDKVRPLCLPADATLSYANAEATAAGWGNDGNYNKGRSPAKLKRIHTEVISGDHCRQLKNNKGDSMKWILE